MIKLNQSQSIRLGKVLETCMALMLEANGYRFQNSKSYENLLTRPDFIVFNKNKPIASIAVTSTSSRETWIKKRWRYIDEVAQLKSYFGEEFLTVNVFYGDPSVFQTSELKVINAFFDASIAANDVRFGNDIEEMAINEIVSKSKKTTNEIAKTIISTEKWNNHSIHLMKEFRHILKSSQMLTKKNLYQQVWIKEYPLYKNILASVKKREYFQDETYLRYSVLKGIRIGADSFGIVIDSLKQEKPLSDTIVELCKKCGIKIKHRTGKKYINDSKLKKTIDAGFTAEIYAIIEKQLFTNPTQEYLLRDIQEIDRLKSMIEAIYPLLVSNNNLGKVFFDCFEDDNYYGIKHARVWPLDVVVAYLGISIAQLNKMYITEYGHVGVASPVEHFVSKTEFIRNRFDRNRFECKDFCQKLADIIEREISNAKISLTKQDVLQLISNNKVKAFSLQPYINPLQRYLEYILHNNGWSYHKKTISCMLSIIPDIPNSMKRIREIYQAKKGDRSIWIKCIAGYDGVKDKTREMAARGRLLQYETPNVDRRDVKMVFVYDGKWTKDCQKLLALSGWEKIIPVLKFDKFLKSI